ncbi:MAG: UDP-N-acetylmuramate dehydrogenase, partial [Chitinophagaceae bacterium]
MLLQKNIQLKRYNTFGISAEAEYFLSVQSVQNIQECLEEFAAIAQAGLPPFPLIVGGGSNILLTADVSGLVLKNDIEGFEVVQEDDQYVFVKVGAGENWHQFVLECIKRKLAGVENLSLIPGSVGAAPMQNIGAYGVEVKDVFSELEAFHLNEKKVFTFCKADCQFGYRESIFKKELKNQFVITSVTFQLLKKPIYNISYGAIKQELDSMGVKDLSIEVISQAVINIRSSKLPDWKILGNAGSFFKNPMVSINQFESIKNEYQNIPSFPGNGLAVKVPAGWLIEKCGWKGYRKKDAGCYEKQALVLVNFG